MNIALFSTPVCRLANKKPVCRLFFRFISLQLHLSVVGQSLSYWYIVSELCELVSFSYGKYVPSWHPREHTGIILMSWEVSSLTRLGWSQEWWALEKQRSRCSLGTGMLLPSWHSQVDGRRIPMRWEVMGKSVTSQSSASHLIHNIILLLILIHILWKAMNSWMN